VYSKQLSTFFLKGQAQRNKSISKLVEYTREIFNMIYLIVNCIDKKVF